METEMQAIKIKWRQITRKNFLIINYSSFLITVFLFLKNE